MLRFFLNPDCKVFKRLFFLIKFKIWECSTFSRILYNHGRMLIGLKSICVLGTDFFSNGNMISHFHSDGNLHWGREWFMIFVTAGRSSDIITIEITSSPSELELMLLIFLRIWSSEVGTNWKRLFVGSLGEGVGGPRSGWSFSVLAVKNVLSSSKHTFKEDIVSLDFPIPRLFNFSQNEAWELHGLVIKWKYLSFALRRSCFILLQRIL